MQYDTVITNGRWFDGTGGPSAVRDIGVRDGRVVAIAKGLDTAGADVIDATGQWVIPGIIDIHTHYDVEILCAPELSESLRHGVTTVMLGSCSLSTVYLDSVDAGDIFGRVEAIPRRYVIEHLDAARSWTNPTEYVAELERLNLGPNLAAFIGHSDLRAATMGLDRATRKDVRPSAAELARMESMLNDALDEGFVGMSSQQLLFDKLDGEVCRSRTLPSTYASPRELRRLNAILRRRDKVLQSGPDIKNPLSVVSQLLTSLGIRRPRLKTSLLSAADIKAIPFVIHVMDRLARVVNALGGDFRWQHLPVPFEVYADGISLVVFEEFGSGAAALHLQTEIERNQLMRDEEYRRRFRKDYDSKYGPRVWHRDFFDAEIVACPDESVIGKSFGQVGVERGGLHPVDAFLDLVVEHGEKLRWRTTISNHRPEVLKKMAQSPTIQMGFSDAGAHLRNMAFYNSGLRLLRHAHDAEKSGNPFISMEHAVHRLTGELGEWYGIDAGTLREGDRADIVVIDPDKLDDSLDRYAEHPVESYGGLSRMVNRNDETVTAVLVSGKLAFAAGKAAPALGKERFGQFLRAGRPSRKLAATG
ncbi:MULTISPECIES: N-acyl-D-amino-acid deacylase family protein [Mycobacterium avium complex (MAC)]|uniref:Amidohydrolase family protein n=2 Tax=Mycobacterium intracellulare TaxID=1767 RepID=A0AAE4RGL1_MYCIT|nr:MULTISPECIES: amidohydrolase family protein [Mycobacterium avium complex (MAC)]AFS14618.1 N-acyl-D-glutamate amidohydrolase [Mycobacterium intracellulare subsp. intracellulare MTCC 9506]MCA2319627.1 amidohydrolase family protein [Mycobacterium intracellulare]MCA2340140.1 amidohydrolase family protein [Mycobacterium intracellulare]MDV6976335.1 amidohydrolase family protein [Mycobacterium intracellulare]MDV6981388.1 amidohydrolase family protein [Mycobacterium intracellulare]